MSDRGRRRLFAQRNLDKAMNEILIAFFIPTLILVSFVFIGIQFIFADELVALSQVFTEPITFGGGRYDIGGGHARWYLLMVVSALLWIPWAGFYIRYIRPWLRHRNIV